jgi:hypothetical protein
MLDRISVLGNDGAKPTINYKGKLRAVSFRTQAVLAAVEMAYRQSLQRTFVEMAKVIDNAEDRAEIYREAAKCLTDPNAITTQDLLAYMGSPASLPAWVRAQVEGFEKATDEEVAQFLNECGTEYMVIFEALKEEIHVAAQEVSKLDPKAQAEFLKSLGLLP